MKNALSFGRYIVFQMLYQIEFENFDKESTIKNILEHNKIRKNSKVEIFAKDLFYEIINNLTKIDRILNLNKKKNILALSEKNILRMGICELYIIKKVPKQVVINEYVELSKKFCDEKAYKYINGILDNIKREADEN